MSRTLTTALLTSFLVACGGGNGDDGNGSGSVSSDNQGFFLDDAVQAITYETGGNPPQLTDENGVFDYEPGTPIEFSVDGIVLGTVEPQAGRVLPTDFGTESVVGFNILQFIQSVDQTPADPGIDLRGVNLPDVQLDFSDDLFAVHPDVIAAVDAAGPNGGGTGTGTLIDRTTAFDRLRASTGLQFNPDGSEFENQVYFPISPGVNEPCLAFFSDTETSPNSGRLEGWSICQDDIAANPNDPIEEFEWRMDITNLELEIPEATNPEERVTVQRRGNTGTRIHTILFSECVPCDPNVEPVFTEEVQTFLPALVLPDFTGTTLMLTASSDGSPVEVDFMSGNTGMLDNGDTFTWGLDFNGKVLELRGTGNPGDTLLYHRLVLIEGNVNSGRMIAILATATDTDNSGGLSDAEVADATYVAIEEFTS